jgi:phosphotransferase system enzyme I (PtsP)
VASRFDTLSAGFLRALAAIAEAGRRAGKPVTLCGEIGGRTLEAMTLIALGYRGLSMSATAIGPVKAMVLSLDAAAAQEGARELLARGGEAASLREPLTALAERLGVRL